MSRHLLGGHSHDHADSVDDAMESSRQSVRAWQSVARLLEPRTMDLPWVVVAAGVTGFAGNEVVASYRIRVGQRIGSAALVADG